MVSAVSFRAATPADRSRLGELDAFGHGSAELDALIAAGRYFVAEARGRVVAGLGWRPLEDDPDEVRVTAAVIDVEHENSGVLAWLRWYATTAAYLGRRVTVPSEDAELALVA